MAFGFSSVITAGLIGEKYEKKYPMTQSLICLIGGLISIPFVIASTLYQKNFYISMFCSAMTIFFSGSYYSPAITMM